ncbi:MAG TPA: ATP-dependent Clp protease ATP-binding subunit [Candidatus Dojkabacteria bacterium]|nr:ATP-dependent Clp protease ATP-binding subunit [Candidatus Dojkabacteria bacterium]
MSQESVDISTYFSQRAKDIIQMAAEKAVDSGSRNIDTEHLLWAAVNYDDVVVRVLKELKVDNELLQDQLNEVIGSDEGITHGTPGLTPRAKEVLQLAFYESQELGHHYIGGEHILLGLIEEREGIAAQIFEKYGISLTQARQAVIKVVGEGDESGEKVEESSITPTLDKYSRDLTKLAKEGKIDPVIGRSDEITRVIQILCRRKKNNPVLIGEPGVGKTAIAEGLAYRIATGNVPEVLLHKTVKELDVAALIAGASHRGEYEERIQKVLKELEKSGRDTILFIDELHTIVGSGAPEGQMDLSNMLKPALARGDIQIIGATTLSEYKKYIEKDAALERRFQIVLVGEPTVDQTIEILRGLRDRYEAHHRVKISDEAITAAAVLSEKYIQDRFLPDKAIDLIDEAASKVKLEVSSEPEELRELKRKIESMEKEREALTRSGNYEKAAEIKVEIEKLKTKLEPLVEKWNKVKGTGTPVVKTEDVAEVLSRATGIPVTELCEEEKDRLLKLEETLHQRVVGQDEAVKAVSEAVRRSRVGLKDPRKPIASFLFMGPTGVGKTLLAKALAKQIFGDEDAIIRIDMSEYMEKFSVSRLIGSPPGYVGYEEGGQLTEAVRRKPYCVILLDEIEKAHSDVFDILLQVLDDGRLTDAQGRTVSFKNTIIIATSNIGANKIQEFVKKGEKDWNKLKEELMADLKSYFKPEFLNRLDDIIVFKSLDKKQIKEIARILLEDVKGLVKAQGMEIEFDDSVIELVASIGYDPEFGARPMERVIQNVVENPLADALLEGKFNKGDTIFATVKDGKIVFEKK